jgi:predicted chitinase
MATRERRVTNNGFLALKPRSKYFGWDYTKNTQLRMTGKEWHNYAKCELFNHNRGDDSARASHCEIWLDGTDINHKPPK